MGKIHLEEQICQLYSASQNICPLCKAILTKKGTDVLGRPVAAAVVIDGE